jgi:hypothetical protein
MVIWNLLDDWPSYSGPFLGPSESIRPLLAWIGKTRSLLLSHAIWSYLISLEATLEAWDLQKGA